MEPDDDDFRETLRRSADAQAILKLALYRESQAALKRAASTSVFMSSIYDDAGSPLQSAFASQAYRSLTDVPLRFGSLRERRSLLVKALGARLMALVKPQDVL